MILCCFRLITGQEQTKAYTVTPLNNTGVLFEDIGNLLAYHNTWSILTEIDLMELDNQTRMAEQAEHLVYQLCSNQTGDLCLVQQKHVHSLLENIKRRTSAIREVVPSSRPRRSLFDGMGNAMHYLFGTMDSTNEREIYSRLEELESNNQALAELEKQQISIVKTTFQQIQKPLSSIQERQRQVQLQLNKMQNSTDQLLVRQWRQEIVSSLTLQLIEIEFRQQALLDIVVASQNKQLHPLVISPRLLLEIYHKSHATCPDTQDCLTLLQQTAETRARMFLNKLVIRVQIPIFTLPQLKLNKIHSFPIQIDRKHSLVPDIPYSHVATHIQTQDFLLIKPENAQKLKKINKGIQEDTYVARLSVPVQRQQCLRNAWSNYFLTLYMNIPIANYGHKCPQQPNN